MKILVAPDSFKGSMKSPEAARALAAGARAAAPGAEVRELPVGDGGEGTLEALVLATGGSCVPIPVTDPLGRPITARLGLLGDGRTVYVEMAEASGLSRLAPEERDPRTACSAGTGMLLRAAAATGRPRVLVGLGGSATNDGGAGLLRALGARLLDAAGAELPPGGAALARLQRLELSGFRNPLPPRTELVVASDVTNPLLGAHGASAVYGPQKHSPSRPPTPAGLAELDAALARLAEAAAAALGRDRRSEPGAGAAGGVGFALLAFLGARLERGAELVLDVVNLDGHLQGADLLLTGEGRIDRQTVAFGKTLSALGRRAQRAGVPVVALAGALGEDLDGYREAGISAVGSIVPGPMPLEEAMARGAELAAGAARRAVELFLAGRRAAG